MAYRKVPQPDGDCCLGGYCWRKFCPMRRAMRRWMVEEAIRRDRGDADVRAGVRRDDELAASELTSERCDEDLA